MRHPNAGPGHRAPRQGGFTLIELIVVIAILAPLVGMLLPAVQNGRTARNAAVATHTLLEMRRAQEIFRSEDRDGDGVLEYAGSVQELVDAGLLDDDLRDGQRQGYGFATEPSGRSVVAFVYLATPMSQGQTGVRGFGGDSSGILAHGCPPGEHPAIEHGELTCVPDIYSALLRLPLGEMSGVAAIDDVNLLAGGIAVERARTLLTPEFVDRVKAEFDADDDGMLSFAELLQADLLAMARRLAAPEVVAGGSIPLGDDGELVGILRRMQDRIRQELALGAGDETTPPAAPLESAVGFPEAVLDLAALEEVGASLKVLLDLVHGLDPTPAAGQMTSPDEATNLERKIRLFDRVDAMFSLRRSGDVAGLRDALVDLRKRADGSPNPGDWVQGAAASRIVARVDATLALVGEER